MTLLDDIWDGLRAAWESITNFFSDEPVGSTVQSCPLGSSEKVVSEKAMERLQAAQEAMDYAKMKLPHGAGNQQTDLIASNRNSYFRMMAARENSNFNISSKVEEIAAKNPAAFQAAKAELAQGGNCGEHAYVVYDYLRQKYPDEHIQLAQKDGFDHAFVMIGDPTKEGADEVVIADAWPTEPTPVLWEDHFAYTPNNNEVLNHASSQGDSHDYKQDMLDAGLSLNDKGNQAVNKSETPEETEEWLSTARGIWDHPYTSKEQHDYVTTPCDPTSSGEP